MLTITKDQKRIDASINAMISLFAQNWIFEFVKANPGAKYFDMVKYVREMKLEHTHGITLNLKELENKGMIRKDGVQYFAK
ncbi:hypothetical protein PHG31p236 [Aeromonas phage 31]|uniref:Uncharacterized protein PHG31ORF239c n=1 Tax=Aeromonas phage 31 TaxID=321023 RepID=Q56EC5_9CAUD|nr:hypothetical protein PHG31p236 [Aeromonas phage 31]APU01129.1 hypothetical protein [Aeromonas phage 31.2]APU02040.1 hypothetical protein [Aeromonas phage L9-6]APU02291.1 hypothetical protein [Aeromonas phage Riv-10]APU02539.1 hypothetical protein [Aeromonas phage SW69-9]AAX63725.1 hypothetical protein PHG31p236 [Aeromonas phage 31]